MRLPTTLPPAAQTLPRDKAILFMDESCALCSRAAHVIATRDAFDRFRICPAGSSIGRKVLHHYGMNPDDPDSWLLLDGDAAYGSLDAVVRVASRLRGWPRLLRVFSILPAVVQDWLYRRIARNRYSMFGRADMCAMPNPELQRRLLS